MDIFLLTCSSLVDPSLIDSVLHASLLLMLFIIRPSPFFRLAANAFPDIGSVGRIEKKQTKKKIHKKSQNRRPWYPRTTLNVNIHIFGLTKCTIYCKKCSCFCSCFSLCCYYAHFQIKRIILSEKWFNCLVTFFFVLKMPKIWVGRTTLNGKKRRWPYALTVSVIQCNCFEPSMIP